MPLPDFSSAAHWFCLMPKRLVLSMRGVVALASASAETHERHSPVTDFLPPGVCWEPDIDYLGEGRSQKADLYLPARIPSGQRVPAVVIIHGGGWTGGDKRALREINIATNLALHGYAALSINYTLATATRPAWPRNLHDCKTAVRWLRHHAVRFQIDPDRIGVIGGSAGGHLAALVALTGPADGLDPAGPYGEYSCQVRCAVDFYGPTDLLEHRDTHMLGKTRAEAPELYRAASPIRYVDPADPPLLIAHGTEDKTVSVRHSELLAEALRRAGVEHELIIIPGAPHTFHLQPKQRDLRPVVLGFFDKHLKQRVSENSSHQSGNPHPSHP